MLKVFEPFVVRHSLTYSTHMSVLPYAKWLFLAAVAPCLFVGCFSNQAAPQGATAMMSFDFVHGGESYDVIAVYQKAKEGVLLAGPMVVHRREIIVDNFHADFDEVSIMPQGKDGPKYTVPYGIHLYEGDGKLTKLADEWSYENITSDEARSQLCAEVIIPHLPKK